MNERYCDDPDCLQPLVPLSEDNELAVHPKNRDFEFGSTIDRDHVGDEIWYIHRSCYSRHRHVRAGHHL
ncbi:MAG TPA: hypothetical protein VK988_12250 [Acidimicrobiales bacterium]|nr:hypothetical protein [Acidimicrobiales bacterium]